jgi:hypothetical protein
MPAKPKATKRPTIAAKAKAVAARRVGACMPLDHATATLYEPVTFRRAAKYQTCSTT